jgi:Short C-terminal domain
MIPLLADDYSFGHVLLGVLYIFFFIIFFWLLITVFADLFRRHDISGWMKAFWILFMIFIPYVGILVYFITQGHGMAERSQQQMKVAQEQLRQQVGYSAADELEKLKKLHDAGTLSDEEYATLKAKAMG